MGRKKKDPTRTVTFNLFDVLYKRYEYDKFVASQDGRKLSMAEWLNELVSEALAARSNAMADEAAVKVTFAALIDTLSTNKHEEE